MQHRRSWALADTTGFGPCRFMTTAWTAVLQAQGLDEDVARESMGFLLGRYWRPVYFFIRQKGKGREEAKDLTQEFFTQFLQKNAISYADRSRGRFRTFLLASVCRFLALTHRAASRRPAEMLLPAVAEADETCSFDAVDGETPETVFERNWAKSLLQNAITRLEQECRALGRAVQFRVFEARFLRASESTDDYGFIAEELGITRTDVDNHLRRAKRRFRRILGEEVSAVVREPRELNEELQALLTCFQAPERRLGVRRG